jgi:hypothetical protein
MRGQSCLHVYFPLCFASPLYQSYVSNLGSQKASAASGLDLLLRLGREVLGLDDHGHLREAALAEHLEVAGLGHVNDGGLAILGLLGLLLGLLRDQRPQALHVHGGAVRAVAQQVEVAHTDLTEVTRVELVHQDTVVVLATGVTATTGVLAVLADTAVAGADVSAFLAVLGKAGRLRRHKHT